MEIKLRKPFQKTITKDGQDTVVSVDKIVLSMDDLKGTDIIDAEREARLRGDTSPNPLHSSEGLAIVAAKVSGLIPEDIMDLSAPDFMLVTNTVSGFLFGWVLPTNLQSEIYAK